MNKFYFHHEIETECQRLLAEYNTLEYSRNRLRKYQKNGVVAEEMIIFFFPLDIFSTA